MESDDNPKSFAMPAAQMAQAGLRMPQIDYAGRKKRTIIIMLVYAVFLGAFGAYNPQGAMILASILALPFIVLAIMWCYYDAEARGYARIRTMLMGLILVFGIAYLFYLFRTRGRGAWKTIGLSLLLVLSVIACSLAGAFVTAMIMQLT